MKHRKKKFQKETSKIKNKSKGIESITVNFQTMQPFIVQEKKTYSLFIMKNEK